jgi:putative transposon-encoded protein
VANIKITDLTAATVPLAGTELFEVVQSGDSKKVAASAIGNSATAVPYLSLAGRAYISAYSTTDQTGSVSAATPVKIENTSFSAGISMANNGSGNPTRITFTVAGTYMLAPSLQFSNSDSTDHDVTIWFRKNGTDIANSATVLSVPKAADGGNAFFQIVLYEQVTAAQYIEVMWLPANVAVTLDYIAAGAIAPAAPSVILASERIA